MIKYLESSFTQRCQNRPFKGRSKNLNHGPSWLGHHWSSVRSFKHLDRSRCGQDELNRLLSVKKSVKFQFQSSSVINNRMEIFFSNFWKIFELEIFLRIPDNPSWSKMTIFDLFDISNYFLPKPTHIWNISLQFSKISYGFYLLHI